MNSALEARSGTSDGAAAPRPDTRGDEGLKQRIEAELNDAEHNAWTALARYKFVLFGYWCGTWGHLNRISGARRANPWTGLVRLARERQSHATGKPR